MFDKFLKVCYYIKAAGLGSLYIYKSFTRINQWE